MTWLEYFKELYLNIVTYLNRDRKKDTNIASGDLAEPFIQTQIVLDKINGVGGVGGVGGI